jgi:hypothetical protein
VLRQIIMPISVTFVLGKKENYFFNTPTHWAWYVPYLCTNRVALCHTHTSRFGANMRRAIRQPQGNSVLRSTRYKAVIG